MSWSIQLVGKDKEKLKAAVRAQQVKDESNPHSGVPVRVADLICSEIDRVKVYQYQGRTYGMQIKGNGSFHDQGLNEHLEIFTVEITE